MDSRSPRRQFSSSVGDEEPMDMDDVESWRGFNNKAVIIGSVMFFN
jgi:hypothetical protein